jgi:hypothetical protein
LDYLPTELRAYLFSLGVAVAAPLLVYWMLRVPLAHFLAAIFRQADIETFWKRVVLLVLVGWTLSSSVAYKPDPAVATEYVALIWNVADQVKLALEALLYAMFALFMPLLLSYTILNVGRDRLPPAAEGAKKE